MEIGRSWKIARVKASSAYDSIVDMRRNIYNLHVTHDDSIYGSISTSHPILANDFSSMDNDALAAHIHAATYRLLALISELDRREVWAAQEALSCAQ